MFCLCLRSSIAVCDPILVSPCFKSAREQRPRCNCFFTDFHKVCSINFEPPDNDLCSACHVYPLSRGAWMISVLFILNRFTWGLNYMNISNPLTFRITILQLSLSMKSQLNVNSSGPKRFDSKRKIFQVI